MPAITHSEKALETLRGLGCDTNGWALAPIEFVVVRRRVPTRIPCPTCHGSGQVADPTPTSARFARVRCPDCPPRRQWPTYGTGLVVAMVERDVEEGRVVWPAGTVHHASRFGDGHHCALCGKRITSAASWRPMLGHRADGTPVSLWTGDDCARSLLGVAARDITMVVAAGEAAVAKADARFWREVPKPPKPVKPAKPALPPQASKAALDAQCAAILGPLWARVESTDLSCSRAQGTYTLLVDGGTGVWGSRFHMAIHLDARYGAKYHPEGPFSRQKPAWADRGCVDFAAALQQVAERLRARIAGDA